jgi:hypothetical protein
MKKLILLAGFLICSNGFSSDFNISSSPFADASVYISNNPPLADVSVYISDSPFADQTVYIKEGNCIFSGTSINLSTSPFADVSIYISTNPVLADVSVYLNNNPALADHSLCVPSGSSQSDIEKYVAAFIATLVSSR